VAETESESERENVLNSHREVVLNSLAASSEC
jgi:hypothetical protein